MPLPYSLIIFDCDGTLVDSEPIANRVLTELINEYGVAISEQEAIDRFVGKSFKDVIDFVEATTGNKTGDIFEQTYRERSKLAFESELQAVPGVIELLEELTVPYCVASNGPREKMQITLSVTGLNKYFNEKNIFSAYDFGEWKPEPGLFLKAAKAMIGHSENCLVIEDTIHGINAAIKAEMKIFGINIKHHLPAVKALDIPIFSSFEEIRERLWG